MLTFLTVWLTSHLQALRAQDPQRGASTVELVIILVGLIAIAILFVALITRVYHDRSTGIF